MAADTSHRLRLLYDLSRRLATFNDLDDVLRQATGALRELFDADGSAVLILDDDTRELRFPLASQREGGRPAADRLAELRFPADQGIAGWVLQHGEALAVEDVGNDPRFYRGIDEATGATTRTLLAAPLRTEGASIGVIEVMNPAPERIGSADIEFLDAVASDIAVAYAKAELHDRLREEAATLRFLTRLMGAVLLVGGIAVAAAAVLAVLARAMPFGTVLTQRALLAGLCAAIAGVAVLWMARSR
jgi:GAF domain-containing protein